MEANKLEKEQKQGWYILAALKKHFLNGDAYVNLDEVYDICKKFFQNVGYVQFQGDFKYLLQKGFLCREGRRVYLAQTLRYEESAAMSVAKILKNNILPQPPLPDEVTIPKLIKNALYFGTGHLCVSSYLKCGATAGRCCSTGNR